MSNKRTIVAGEYTYTRDEDGRWAKTCAEWGDEGFKLIPSEIELAEHFVKMIDEIQKGINSIRTDNV